MTRAEWAILFLEAVAFILVAVAAYHEGRRRGREEGMKLGMGWGHHVDTSYDKERRP